MTRVTWANLDPTTYEDMVAVLLSRLHPDAQRIDGSSGDGGRDVQIPTTDGLEIFELKSFTGRVSSSRRQQIKRSLSRAAEHSPVSWTLVVPIDPAPAEEQWFDRLRGDYTFPLDWKGRTWLDGEMASHPELRRYYLEGGNGAAMRALKEIHQEQAALANGVPDAVARARALVDRVNDLDPHYAFDLRAAADGTVQVTVRERYRGAVRDRPITLDVQLRFPADAAGQAAKEQFRDALAWGAAADLDPAFVEWVRLNAPAGLGGEYTNAALHLRASTGPAQPLRARLEVLEVTATAHEHARVLSGLDVVFAADAGHAGARGLVLRGQTTAPGLHLELRADLRDRTGRVTLRFETPEDAPPGQLLPVLRLLHDLRAPHHLALRSSDDPSDDRPWAMRFAAPSTPPLLPTEYTDLIEALARVQDATGVYFAVPEAFTPRDVAAVRDADALLRGQSVTTTWTHLHLPWTPASPEAVQDALGHSEARQWRLDCEAYPVHIAGHAINLGPVRRHIHAGVVADRRATLRRAQAAVRAGTDPAAPVDLRLEPGAEDDRLTIRRLTEPPAAVTSSGAGT